MSARTDSLVGAYGLSLGSSFFASSGLSASGAVFFAASLSTAAVSADAYAKSVEILNQNEDLILSDNYFDLNADSKTVKVISGSVDKLRLRSVYDIN